MKRILKMTALASLIMLGSSLPKAASAQNDYYEDYDQGYDQGYDQQGQQGDVSYQTFYDELSPHGNWIEYPGHGYVWQPSLGNNFRPYSTGGHWVWSDQYEWVWVSDYDWGWAPFHYGRWFSDPRYGWLWVPGYEWSGAWVTWRDGGDYYGWAPIRPGISISINFNIGGYSPPIDYWSFAPRRYILSRNIYNHCIDYRRNVTIINHTTIINNYNYGDRYGFRTGPRRYDFERYTGRVNPVQFRQSSRPGRTQFRNNEVSIYRPTVRQNNTTVAPRRFDRADRTSTNRNTNTSIDTRSTREGNDFRGNRTVRENPNTRVRTNEAPVRSGNGNGNNRFERRETSSQPADGGMRNPPTRENRIERNNNGQSNQEIRTQRQRTERPVTSQGAGSSENRRFERRSNENAPVRQQEIRTAPQTQRQAPQRMERREAPQQRVEQRREAPQQQRRQEPRQVERQNNGTERQQGAGNSENGKGNGKRRF